MERGRERGLMRASARAATLSNNGVRWLKYNCTRHDYSSRYYEPGSWELRSTTSNFSDSKSGYSDASFNYSTGDWTLSGSRTIRAASGGGTVYIDSGDAATPFKFTISSYGEWKVYLMSAATGHTSYWSIYTKGTYVGAIYADEGIYPDAEANYVYVTTFTDSGVTYTVMRNGYTYYCYCKG